MYRSNLLTLAAMSGLFHAEPVGAASDGPRHINPNLIKVDVNPLVQDVEAQIQKKLIEMKDVSFSFRTVQVPDPDLGLDEKGNVKTKDFKRPTLVVSIPQLTVGGLIAGLQSGDKTTELILEASNQIIIDRARGMLQDKVEVDPSIVLKVEDIDQEQLNLAAIASLPRSARGAGIAKEAFQAFVADYKAVMATDKAIALFADQKARSPEVLDKHAILLAGKFNQVKSRKDVVAQMKGFLDIWVQVTDNAEEHVKVYEFLQEKADAIMKGESFDDL